MMKKVSLFLVITLFATMGIFAQSNEKAWTLTDCIEYAKENNINVQQAVLQSEQISLDFKQSKLDFLPDVSGSAGYNWTWGRSLNESTYEYINRRNERSNYSLGANLIIFNGMQQINYVKYHQIQKALGTSNIELSIDNISLELTQAYLQVLLSKELVIIAYEQVTVLKEQVTRTEAQVEAGTLPVGELLDIQAQLSKEEFNVVSAENNQDMAYLTLKQLLDLPADATFDIVIPNIEKYKFLQISPSGTIYQQALSNRPEIKSAELTIEGQEKYINILKGNLYPTLSFSAGISTWYSDPFAEFDPTTQTYDYGKSFGNQFIDNRSPYLGFNLNIPIFSGYRYRTNIKKAVIVKRDAELQLKDRKNVLRKTIEQAANDAIADKKSFESSLTAIDNYQLSFTYSEEKLNVGMANTVDYILAKNNLLKAQSDMISAKYNYIFKVKILEFYKGVPLSF